jgi:hypothetical protein
MTSRAKHFTPESGILPDIKEDSANESKQADTSADERPLRISLKRKTKNVNFKVPNMEPIFEGTDFASDLTSPIVVND